MNQFDIDLRNEWRQLSTPDLEAMMQAELEKKPPDDDVVLLLLHILEERQPEELDLTDREQASFDRYKQRVRSRGEATYRIPRWLTMAANFAVIIGLLFTVVPQQAEAETFWEMLQRMSKSVVEFLSRDERLVEDDYVFITDNPGLQQVYDAVVELGVTEPVVPMWLPEGCEISRCEEKITPTSKCVFATFSKKENGEIVYEMDLYTGEPAHQYYKDDSFYESYEQEGAVFFIARNNERWSVVWTIDNIECHITLDCQEETLRRILRSIYVMEE